MSSDILEEKDKTKQSYTQLMIQRFMRHRLALISLFLVIFVMLLALLAPLISPHPPNAIVGKFSAPPSFQFWLGTDQIGRDIFSRLLFACRVSLLVGLASTAISVVIGVVLGLLSGYFGGWIDMLIMRMTDIVMSFPYLMLVLVAAALIGPGLTNIILILGFVNWPGVARLTRSNVLSLKESGFVKNSIVQGMSTKFILFSEILPNTIAPILVYSASNVAIAMLDEAALSFLGLGVQAPTASLGNMLNGAQSLTILTSKPWLWMPPGIMIVMLVLMISLIGDALRDALDPRDVR